MKPIIGVTPLYNKNLDTIWILTQYFDLINNLGGVPIMLSFCRDRENLERSVSILDGIVFTGGQDIDPKYYNQAPKENLGAISKLRDELEWDLLDVVLEKNIPVLGICRGFQIINVKLGGSLIQDIPSQYKTDINHSMGSEGAFKLAHSVNVDRNNPFSNFFKEDSFMVNTLHHQGIENLGEDLIPLLHSEDGLVEGFTHRDKFILGVQFHPELIYQKSETVKNLVREFIKEAKKNME